VLLIDDGELDDVERMLAALGADAVRLRGGARERGWRQPTHLLVVTGRRALDLGRPVAQEEGSFTKLAVFEDRSKTHRAQLEAMGFDSLIRRPVHPEALRLLLQQALHRHHDQRREIRLPIGCDVVWRAGWRRRRATLLEISGHGCSLRVDGAVDPGYRVSVEIPGDLMHADSLRMDGRVVRFRGSRPEAGPLVAVLSILFDEIAPELRRSLEALLERIAGGPPTLIAP
jgi:hypothetical protein